MDEAVDQVMGRSSDEKGADKAVGLRRSQQKERVRLQSEITAEQKIVAAVSEERAPIAAEVRKVEAEVGPIKYIAKFLYGEHGADENMLEQAVTWIIVLIVIVFDPLAVIMLLAAQMTFVWAKEEKEKQEQTDTPIYVTDVGEKPNEKELTPEPEAIKEPEVEYQFVEEDHEPDYPTADNTIATTDTEPEMPMPIEQWNAMIEEAEKEAEAESKKYQILPELQKHIDESTVEERIARGDSYIDTQGTEVNLEENDSKKKTYMIKNPLGEIEVKNRS
jgi:hypothetical protein